MNSDLRSDVRRRLPAARNHMVRCLGTIPAAGGSQGNTGPSDRTGRLAVAYIDNPTIDPARHDLDRLNTILNRGRGRGWLTQGEWHTLADLCDTWNPTDRRRQAIHANLQAAANDLLNKHNDHGNCRSCKRDPGSWGEPHANGLCKSCKRYLDRIHVLYDVTIDVPPLALIVVLRERGKVTDQDIHNAMIGKPRRDA